ncbi:ATP-dependent helicase HrpB [Cohnella cholangitidis]|uniref:ATP-dependent helicase HrpB n=1 Tax=Cohnella cholangitidis TaxID=2598458 RepID=A0A7G5C6V2_9BACL|nr:ATP-dependent helicase HrpB [Cohnella cholangitidis]QMV44936.1 ATP-dependent helicase HrpB [Cohnella cholangitidis]
MGNQALPIEAALPELLDALRTSSNAVLVAAPGAGKTTRVPLALLEEAWLNGQKIVMLEPRRLAARSSAKRMADTLGEQVGETVGYRVKMDTKVGPRTRIEVVTEGVLTRMLQADPALEGTGLVIFDEYHERSLQADLGLALCLQSQELLREELKLLVMSATLEAEPVADLLKGAPIVRSEGRSFPVDTHYRPKARATALEEAVSNAVADALRAHEGDVLVFLPGVGEIRAVESKLGAMLKPGDHSLRICPLHGGLTSEDQDRALAPLPPGRRKVVLATSVAETSLTVEGVTVVIDSGLMRVSRFSPRTGMSRLDTVTVSAASADQRRGRAGRLMPGTCYRLWSKEEQMSLSPRSAPEIMEADLAPLLLELSVWGVQDVAELDWLDAPPAPALQQARDLLVQLGALDKNGGSVTAHGKRMAEVGKHPRLAHMLLRAMPIGLGELGCELAVVLGERDFIRYEGKAPRADIRHRIEALRGNSHFTIEEGTRRRLAEEVKRLQRELGIRSDKASGSAEACGLLLAFAYPDRIGRQRDNGKYLLSGGRGAEFGYGQALAHEPWIVAAEVDDAGTDSRIRLAAALPFEMLQTHLQEEMNVETNIYWDSESKTVRSRARKKLGALLLEETPASRPPADRVLEVLLEGIRAEGMELLPWTKAARQLQERTRFVRRHDASWPDLSDEALLRSLEQWLAGYIEGMKGRSDLQRLNLKEILESVLTWEQRRELDDYAPTHWTVPSGTRVPIDYSDFDAPSIAVRLQELFGLPETPRIAGGRVPLTLHLLSPAQRPVQVTRDLVSFWNNAYFEVRKDLKGRYPKHYWPDNPLEAEATRRVRPSK